MCELQTFFVNAERYHQMCLSATAKCQAISWHCSGAPEPWGFVAYIYVHPALPTAHLVSRSLGSEARGSDLLWPEQPKVSQQPASSDQPGQAGGVAASRVSPAEDAHRDTVGVRSQVGLCGKGREKIVDWWTRCHKDGLLLLSFAQSRYLSYNVMVI